VKLLPKRPAQPSVDGAADSADAADGSAAAPGGKGRPTPKRREVVPQRGPVTAPKTRKEAYARQKQQARQPRTARRTPSADMTVSQRRALLRAGDESVLPRRDQGPTRKLARDWVDSHRMASNYLLLLFPLMVATYVIPQAAIVQLVIIAMFFGLLVEWYVVGARLRRMAIERFGSAQGGSMSIGFYAGSRAYLPRRWRLPAPQVERGDEI
jgi:DUF3043 family protein